MDSIWSSCQLSIICLGIKPYYYYYYFISKSVSYLDTFKLFLWSLWDEWWETNKELRKDMELSSQKKW